jgi:vitamin B12 transporter
MFSPFVSSDVLSVPPSTSPRLRGGRYGSVKVAAAVTLALISSSSVAQAQSVGVPPASGDTIALAEVVVTASRVTNLQLELPQSITVLQGADLETRGVVFLVDALREVPGIQVVRTGSTGGSTSVFMRGGNSNFVKVLLDGVPLNEPGGRFDFGTFTLENVERIEVVRGPSSVLYGTDAVSGVIQIFTKQGRGAPQVGGALRAGTQGVWGAEAHARGASDRLSYALSLGRSAAGGIYEVNSGFESLVGSARVEVHPDALTRLALTLRLQETTFRFPTNSNGEVVDLNQFTFDDGVQLSMEGVRALTPSLEGRLQLRAALAERGFENAPDSPQDTVGFGFRSLRTGSALRRGGDARLVWRQERGTLSGGIDWELERERLQSRTESNFGGGVTVSADGLRETRWNVGTYGEGVWEAPLGVRLSAGARADQNEVFGTFATGQVGIVLPLPGALGRLRGAAGSAFKAPTFSNQFAASAFEVGNPDLEPESSRGFEVGWDAGFFGNRLVLAGAGFEQSYDNLIQYAFRGAGLPSYWNEAKARSTGAEASARWRSGAGWEVGGEWSWTHARLETVNGEAPAPGTDTRLLRRPARVVVGTFRTPLPVAGARAGLVVHQVGSRIDQDFRSWPAARVTLPSHTTADFDLQLQLPALGRGSNAMSGEGNAPVLTFRVENLFDEPFETIVGFPGQGRLVHLGVRWNP